jgi:hypothetical protein
MGKVKSYYFDILENSMGSDPDEYEDIPSGWDVDVDENGPFIVMADSSTDIDMDRDVPDIVWEPEYMEER